MLVPEVPVQRQRAVVTAALPSAGEREVEVHGGGVGVVRCERALECVREQRLQHHGRGHGVAPVPGVVALHIAPHPVETRTAETHGLRHALHGEVHRAPGGQRECRRIVGADSGEDPVEVLQTHEPRDGSPRAARHAAGYVDSEEAAVTGPIDDGVQRALSPCEVECRGAGDNGLVRREIGEGTKCAGAVGDGWGGEHLPRERGGPERGERDRVHFIWHNAFCNDLHPGHLLQPVDQPA